jgi:hypothetical protein
MRNVYKILLKKSEGRKPLEDLFIEGITILKEI